MASTAQGASASENAAEFVRTKALWGATALPLPAQLEYRTALEHASDGDYQRAEQHLSAAIKLAPDFPDAYFTLSRIKFRQFDPDALYFFVRGVRATWESFEAQSLLAVNVVLIAAFTLILALSVVLLAFALRYLPFIAHRIAEVLDRKFNAAAPRVTAYLFIAIPFVLFPGFVTGACVLIVMTWHLMQNRERIGLTLMLAPVIAMGLLAPQLERFSVAADPESFTMLAARSNYESGDPELIDAIARTEVKGLEAERHNALGMLYLRQEEYDVASNNFLKAIALKPDDAVAYVNLGNVYYRQGLWHKALEGYRKATSVDSVDAVGRFNLAQAYIKTLLMAESSKALHEASEAGIARVRESFATVALPNLEVYPKGFSAKRLWGIAAVEGAERPREFFSAATAPLLGFSLRVSAWVLLVALALALIVSRAIKPRHYAFQCSNCGELMCESCGGSDRGSFICEGCSAAIAEVSSEKVVDALLRQRRQKIVVKRRKSFRFLTIWLPGLRHVFYGSFSRGATLALLCALSLVGLWSRGYAWPGWNSLTHPFVLWKLLLPAAGVILSYLMSMSSKRLTEVRNYRRPTTTARSNEQEDQYHAQSA